MYEVIYDILVFFFLYGFIGWCAEVAFAAMKERRFVNRGFLNGPICPIYGIGVTVVVSFLMPYRNQFVALYLLSVFLVTLLEGVTGFLMEKLFHHRWWDYSGMPLNIGGYVCLLFSVMWGAACVVIVHFIHPTIVWLVSFVPVWLGWTLLTVLSFVLIADLYVTVTNILKFNRSLERMESIAEELHRISDMLGENIYKNTMEGIELQDKMKSAAEEARQKTERAAEEVRQRTGRAAEEVRQRTERAAEEVRQKTERAAEEVFQKTEQRTAQLRAARQELRTKYKELAENISPVNARLLRAFPKMKPRRYEKAFAGFKEYLKERRNRGKK